MASKKTTTRKPAAKKPPAGVDQKQIEAEVDDPFERAARVQTETSNDGRFSTYEIAPKADPRDGDLILQYRGAPKED